MTALGAVVLATIEPRAAAIFVQSTTLDVQLNLPRICASTIWTFCHKFVFVPQKGCSVGMALALHWKAIIQVMLLLELIQKGHPNFFALSAVHEGAGIPK